MKRDDARDTRPDALPLHVDRTEPGPVPSFDANDPPPPPSEADVMEASRLLAAFKRARMPPTMLSPVSAGSAAPAAYAVIVAPMTVPINAPERNFTPIQSALPIVASFAVRLLIHCAN